MRCINGQLKNETRGEVVQSGGGERGDQHAAWLPAGPTHVIGVTCSHTLSTSLSIHCEVQQPFLTHRIQQDLKAFMQSGISISELTYDDSVLCCAVLCADVKW